MTSPAIAAGAIVPVPATLIETAAQALDACAAALAADPLLAQAARGQATALRTLALLRGVAGTMSPQDLAHGTPAGGSRAGGGVTGVRINRARRFANRGGGDPDAMVPMPAKYPGHCCACGLPTAPGDAIVYQRGHGPRASIWHAACAPTVAPVTAPAVGAPVPGPAGDPARAAAKAEVERALAAHRAQQAALANDPGDYGDDDGYCDPPALAKAGVHR